MAQIDFNQDIWNFSDENVSKTNFIKSSNTKTFHAFWFGDYIIGYIRAQVPDNAYLISNFLKDNTVQ